ncbi:5-methyltetrahydropteroyltriglutamate--homocysteine S-methyltransferase [Mucilaginibacter polytrichastri]|uniref:5-methyltetrahydropteroyltriglutamate--homocysteine methyltransferase n=1 Tax=Mucilaginibacter polytrichastri TaxID=1302689 RepID=A0A1Q6A022_9SPHI|nr:5-methyltetrahydropteroyltriglutamate--homocysteine S-methyltransferase [Mucilaginibacter polytrichastri]OKS87353.1 5-methyltetrahydropteroyltriglutamate--homocysteine methyltransferase [Mucilaginibacter polytrichastri]SFT21982.1 methionine synthase (B12-independent) [Mucilaginibacter polytrichastri]
MLKNNLGYPRMGSHRQLKKACEQYWAGKIDKKELHQAARKIKEENWQLQLNTGIDLVPCNDFSFYDQVLDMSLLLGAIPSRYTPVLTDVKTNEEIDLYFAMARGYQKDGLDITAMEMTKWFDTNYHYIVPEFTAGQKFRIFSENIFSEFNHACQICGKAAKPVLLGPVSYLLAGKEKEAGFEKIDLIKALVPVYIEIINRLKNFGAEWIQLDEPFLVLDLSKKEKQAFEYAYAEIAKACKGVKLLVATYFDALLDNSQLAVKLPVTALHIDLVRAPEQLDEVLALIPADLILSLGVIDGRNVWKNDFMKSSIQINRAVACLGEERVMIAPSCSLLHTPFDLDQETEIQPEIKNWMAFAKQKLEEVNALFQIISGNTELLHANQKAIDGRRSSSLIHKEAVKQRVATITENDAKRISAFPVRQQLQQQRFKLPLFPTTTIGSFPQTDEIRQLRSKFKKGELTVEQYDEAIEKATIDAIRLQEQIGLDVLVHGEFERNDMVEYFGEQLDGYLFTKNGWVQSYGSRCVKPPVIFGDVSRPKDMTVRWSHFAQQQTSRPMKGMLTGPITILQWSFVRDDQPRSVTANQIALAIRDEVVALETAGIGIIQIDEPAIREGLPLRKANWPAYLNWAVKAFRISASGVQDQTQIHTHMCYSEFNDIIENIAAMDADVITIETSRSQMDLLNAFADFEYPNEIGPGVYDIHSPRVPTTEEMVSLLEKAATLLPAQNIWVNPDCGLKTRHWPETLAALQNMVAAAKQARANLKEPQTL